MPTVCKILVLLLVLQYLHAQEIRFGMRNDPTCDCKSIFECADLKALLDRRDFGALKTHQSCGFDKKMPRYCCPAVEQLIPRTSTQDPREAYFSQLKKVCGLADVNRIFGGKSVGNHEFPWLAALLYGDSVRCGGVLVSHNVLVTAAHCINDKLDKVLMGHADLNQTKEFQIESVLLHPDFDIKNRFLYNDLAMIKITESLVFDNAIKPICLPEREDDISWRNETAIVSGWGFTEDWKLSNELLQVELKHVDPKICQSDFRAKGAVNFKLSESQICAQGLPGHDSCQGDSGGPLMYPKGDKNFLIGITSFGTRKCNSFVPGVYTDVFKHINWIQNFIFDHVSKE